MCNIHVYKFKFDVKESPPQNFGIFRVEAQKNFDVFYAKAIKEYKTSRVQVKLFLYFCTVI